MCIKEINKRLDLVQLFVDDSSLTCQVRNCLNNVGDIERCLLRLHYQSSGLNDFLNILKSLETVSQISMHLTLKKYSLDERHLLRFHLQDVIEKLGSFSDLLNLSKILVEDVSETANVNGFIRDGVSSKLDYMRQKREEIFAKKAVLINHLSQSLEMRDFSLGVDLKHGPVLEFPKLKVLTKKIIEAKLKESPEIKICDSQRSSTTLRCSFDSWTRLYDEIKKCEENISSEEHSILDNACEQIKESTFDIIECTKCLAEIDVSASLGILAKDQNYVRPILTEGTEFEIIGGRHPVIEMSQRTRNSTFVKNDSNISGTERLWLLTGANMGGKSTFLRQWYFEIFSYFSAIIIILSQIGAFIPADKVILGGKFSLN